MKYSPKNYAVALNQALEGKPETKKGAILKNFLAVLKKNGDQRLARKILEIFKGLVVRQKGGHHVLVELARENPDSSTQSILKKFGEKDWVETSINPSLVAGIRVTLDGEQELDNSLAKKLHKLFNRN